MSSRSRLPSADPARRRAAEGARSWRFLALYALANAGGVAAFLPLLTLLLPLKVQAVAGDERLVTLTLCADRKSTRLNSSPNAPLVCRLPLENKKPHVMNEDMSPS